MRPRDRDLAMCLYAGLRSFERTRLLPGIADPRTRTVLVEQLLESLHRVEYVKRLGERNVGAFRADPNDLRFDPLKAAVINRQNGELDEAAWLVFLSVHFGKHLSGWRYVREIYGRLGNGERWTWSATAASPDAFRTWLDRNAATIRRKGVPGGFGNHRKYQSLDAYSPNGTGAVVASYVGWVVPFGGHASLFGNALDASGGDPRGAFDELYRSMKQSVRGFGRLALFDNLAMLGKLGLARIEPGSTYLQGGTGPLRGARLLFGGGQSAGVLDGWLADLDRELKVGMQVLEDALCNWQKSPDEFMCFRG